MWVKRKRQRLNSTALWQGWKAKVVHHINQKLVTKKSGSNWSAMLALPSLSSGSTIKRFSVETCFSFSPNAGAHSLFPARNNRDWDDIFVLSFQSKISFVTVLV